MEETMVDSETIVAVQTIIKSVLYVQYCKYMYCLSIYGLFKYSEQSIMIVAVFVNHHLSFEGKKIQVWGGYLI